MRFNRYNSLNFRVHFFQVNIESQAKYTIITNQTLHNFFINTSNVSVMNVSCRLGI